MGVWVGVWVGVAVAVPMAPGVGCDVGPAEKDTWFSAAGRNTALFMPGVRPPAAGVVLGSARAKVVPCAAEVPIPRGDATAAVVKMISVTTKTARRGWNS